MAVGSLLILPGDGIGPEVMDEVCRIIEWFEKKLDIEFEPLSASSINKSLSFFGKMIGKIPFLKQLL